MGEGAWSGPLLPHFVPLSKPSGSSRATVYMHLTG
jgi:hypothetical protein